MVRPILFCGLGGGLDIVNASILYFLARSQGIPAILGSTRPAPEASLSGHRRLDDCLSMITKDTRIEYKGRYIEPRIAEVLDEDVLFLSRRYNDVYDPSLLRDAILHAIDRFSLSHIFFIDGGGDALILKPSDSNEGGRSPFMGGDAELLNAVKSIPNVYMAVISPGLDIKYEAFLDNVQMLEENGGYYGRINFRTGMVDGYKLNEILPYSRGFLPDYFQFAESVLVLSEQDQSNTPKMPSLTATVTYHALKGYNGLQRTFVGWENIVGPDEEGNDTGEWKRGTIVKEQHSSMYFLDPSVVEKLKNILN